VPLLYDADCAFCTRAARVGARVLRGVAVQPLQDADLAALGVDPARAQAQLPYVAPDGSVSYGSDAIAHALVDAGLPAALAGRVLLVPGIRQLAHGVYHLVSRYRHRLPGGSGSCQP
jgi:predicted DCC family thiol-disulfide oxidoreductase YuxK